MKALIESLRIGPEKNFCYLIMCQETFECALIDPAFECDRIIAWVTDLVRKKNPNRNASIQYLIATHGHWDHAGGMPEMLKRVPGAKVVAGKNETSRLKKNHIPLHKSVDDEEEFFVGRVKIKALHTPGHTEGGACFIVDDQIFTGDTLFVGQCGRTDFEGGSDELLFSSLQKLKTLPGGLIVRPGHDYGASPESTISKEIATNPTMGAQSIEEFKALP